MKLNGSSIYYSIREWFNYNVPWNYYRMRDVDKLCDYDTDRILPVKISPDKIKYKINRDSSCLPGGGENAVVGQMSGFWDKVRIPINKTTKYVDISNNISGMGGKHVALINSLKKRGYKPQQELEDAKKCDIRNIIIHDEPRLAVGRHNEIMSWSGGHHRIAASQLLDIDYIYAYIVLWHPEADYEKFKKKHHTKAVFEMCE